MTPERHIDSSRVQTPPEFFPAPGLCSLFARAKMLYRRLVDDLIEIFVHKRPQIARVCMVTTVNICKVIFLTTGLNHYLNCAALN